MMSYRKLLLIFAISCDSVFATTNRPITNFDEKRTIKDSSTPIISSSNPDNDLYSTKTPTIVIGVICSILTVALIKITLCLIHRWNNKRKQCKITEDSNTGTISRIEGIDDECESHANISVISTDSFFSDNGMEYRGFYDNRFTKMGSRHTREYSKLSKDIDELLTFDDDFCIISLDENIFIQADRADDTDNAYITISCDDITFKDFCIISRNENFFTQTDQNQADHQSFVTSSDDNETEDAYVTITPDDVIATQSEPAFDDVYVNIPDMEICILTLTHSYIRKYPPISNDYYCVISFNRSAPRSIQIEDQPGQRRKSSVEAQELTNKIKGRKTFTLNKYKRYIGGGSMNIAEYGRNTSMKLYNGIKSLNKVAEDY